MATDKKRITESLTGYAPQKAFLDAILDHPGEVVQADLKTYRAALSFRMRCYELRKADRRNNKIIFPEPDPRYGRSDYDSILLSIRSKTSIITGEIQAVPTITITGKKLT